MTSNITTVKSYYILLNISIKQKINNKEITVAIFVDLSKAFDTVDKQILEHILLHQEYIVVVTQI